MKMLQILAILLIFSVVGCTVYPHYPPAEGADIVGGVHHYGITAVDGVGANFKGFIIVPAGVTFYNALIDSYGSAPQDTMGTGKMVGFIPALTHNFGITPRADGNFDMSIEAHVKYKAMIGWYQDGIKAQSVSIIGIKL